MITGHIDGAARAEGSRTHIFSSYPREGSPESNNCELWKAGRATGAAPTFLDPMKINGRTYVDGAIAANNPVEVSKPPRAWSSI